jgi:SAM-dependent methyltransferase
MASTPVTIDFSAIKARQQGTWSSGDYSVIGTALQITGELLCESVDVAAGERVLDVAAGNGNAALAAARRGCYVTASDFVPELLAAAQGRAKAEGLAIEIYDTDAESMPFDEGRFDVVLSTFGVMFTPDQGRAAAELRRVCRPGGRIGLASWTPESFVGQMFRIIGRYAPPPAGVPSPLDWGKEGRVAELLDVGPANLQFQHRQFVFRYRSSENWFGTFRNFYGPIYKAFEVLDPAGQAALEHDLVVLAGQYNTGRNGAVRIPSEYLEVVATNPA